ncbi:MAG: methyltransferase domain-containing protein, partial [Thermoanaerobaculia bacterium]
MPNVYTFKDFEGSSHRILMGLIRRYAKRGGTLLDLGAAGGELGAAVRDHFRRTLGFEYQVDCIADLKQRFDDVVITDLEKLKRIPENVDAIVCADVIEHLRDAPSLLKLVRRGLARDG